MGHTIKENAPQRFEELRQLIRREFYTAASWENAVEMRRKQYADALGREISREYAEEEVVCNSLGRLLGNERVMEKLARENKNLFAKIWRAVKAFFEKLFGGMKQDYSAKTPEQVLVENGTRKAQQKLEDAFVNALRASSKASGAIAELTVTDEAKSADPVTYDNNGNVIPLSERFKDSNRDIRWSLNEFPDGQRFVKVVAAQSLFDGLTLKEQTDLATRIIKSKFQGKVIGIDNRTFVNGVTANEYTHPSKHIEEDVYTAKIRASAELDNLIDAGYNFRKGDDGKDGHLHLEAVDGFDYFDVIFYLGGEYYQGLINIINNKRGKRLKDITKIKNITKDMVSRYGANPSYTFLRDTSINSIPDSAEKINLSDEKSSERISESGYQGANRKDRGQ